MAMGIRIPESRLRGYTVDVVAAGDITDALNTATELAHLPREDVRAGGSSSTHDGDTVAPQSAVPPHEVNSAAKKPRARRTKKSA